MFASWGCVELRGFGLRARFLYKKSPNDLPWSPLGYASQFYHSLGWRGREV